MSDWPNWLGDLPSWVTTATIAIAALHYRNERGRRRAEEERDSKEQASKLCAWVAFDKASEGSHGKRGVVIANSSGSTFHNVTIQVQIHKNRPITTLHLLVLPPGSYYAEHQGEGKEFPWAFPDPIGPTDPRLRPYMKSPDYLIRSIDFHDALGQRWQTDERSVLTLIERLSP